MLRLCDPYELDVPDDLADRTGYVFEEAGGGEADRLVIEVEALPADVRPADMIAANRKSAARALGGDPGWPEGQVDTGLGPARTLTITDPEIAGGVWVAALRDDRGRMWTLRFESAREWADTVFLALVAAIGGGSLPPGWAHRRAHGTPLALPTWLRPPRVYRFTNASGDVRCILDQGSSDMPGESEFEAWGEPAPASCWWCTRWAPGRRRWPARRRRGGSGGSTAATRTARCWGRRGRGWRWRRGCRCGSR
ncbi:hypothetical protein [Nannocystis punicea]|uniref:Uncharacterized protein n=1 Tax=Nannocystis punicea TaxID=2995304 RepID=A0ABY7H685_9BACT|nr:hypothetical protein [Nannocystis poenicansa]WAS94791.1 hypothetical protein O0S08_01410 [Nannocystis poenicansa]